MSKEGETIPKKEKEKKRKRKRETRITKTRIGTRHKKRYVNRNKKTKIRGKRGK